MKDDELCLFMIFVIIAILFISTVCDPTPMEQWSVEDCPVCEGVGYFECVCGDVYDCQHCE